MAVMMRRMVMMAGLLLWLGTATTASAQVLGTFSWQMQPYCNVVTLTITQIPGGYTIDGNDNQCGAAKVAGAAGMALINPDGTVGLDFTIVTAPAGKALHVSASLSPATGSGPWTDSVGHSGTLALGANAGGAARPLAASGLGPAVITATEIAPGAVGATNINTSQVQTRVTGTCPAGQAVTSVNLDGTVACAPAVDAEVYFHAAPHATSVITATTSVLWPTILSNTGGGTYSPATGAYSVPRNGLYLVTYSVLWVGQVSSAGRRCTYIEAGSGELAGATCGQPPGTFVAMSGSAVLRLSAGTSISVRVNQTSGVADTILNAPGSDFTVTRLR